MKRDIEIISTDGAGTKAVDITVNGKIVASITEGEYREYKKYNNEICFLDEYLLENTDLTMFEVVAVLPEIASAFGAFDAR